MKRLCKYLFLTIVLLILPISVEAISIDTIDIDVYVDKSGNAHVTEKWFYPEANSGDTEFYKSYNNLGKMKISDFTVSYNNIGNFSINDDYSVTYNDKDFTYVDDWDIDESFSEKSYKNGLYYEDGKTELCWGISNYTSGTYTLKYTIENFVVKLNDADMVYFNFIPSGNNIEKFHLKLYSDEKFNDKLPVWGFGKKNGTAYVYDGYVEMNSEGSMSTDEYIVLLAKFNKDSFTSSYKIDKNFDYYLKMAKKGSKSSINSNPVIKIIKSFLAFVFSNLFIIFFIVITFIGVIKSKNKIGSYRYDFGKFGRKLPKEVNKIRDIPFKNIYKVYLYSTVYGLNKKKTDLLGAVLLKWLKEKKISLIKTTSKVLKKEESAVVLNKDFTSDNNLEVELYKMMYEASNDGVLESKELEKWCRDNYDEILEWFDYVLNNETVGLNDENILIREKLKMRITDKFVEEACLVKGVKEFLLEFSRIDEKEAIEVNLWDEYLMYAQIFGIADKVAKQFKKLYPDEINAYNERYGYDMNDIMFIHMISSSGMSSAISSRDKANSYNSGGGGFMSGGGGGGSFGGGGSMGSR